MNAEPSPALKRVAFDASHAFPDGGECGRLLRAMDWSASPLGEPAEWPESLKTLVAVMLGSSQPMLIVWGEALTTLYNDGYAAMCGARHPGGFGGRFDALWAEIWDEVRPIVAEAYAGRSVSMDDIQFTMTRNGYPEEAHFRFSYTPVRGADGTVAGIFCICEETTETVAAQRRRATEAERLSRMFEQAPGFMCLLRGPDFVYEAANPAYERLVGRTDLVGRRVADVMTDAGARPILERMARVLTGGRPWTGCRIEIRVPEPDGGARVRYVDMVWQPLRGEDGSVDSLFIEGLDVTAQVEAEAARRAADAAAKARAGELEAIYEAAPVGLAVIDADLRYVRVNARLAAMNGIPVEAHVGKRPDELFGADKAARMMERLRRGFAGEPIETVEIRARDTFRDRQGRWLVSYEPVRDEAGRITHLVGSVQDVKAWRQAERRASDVLARMNEGFAVLDRDFRVIDINAEALRLDGRPREAIVGLTYREAWPALAGTPVEALYRSVMETGEPGAIEHRHMSDEGEIWLDIRAYPCDDGVALFYRDASPRKAAEARLQRSEAAARDGLAELQSIYENAPVGLCVIDREMRFLRINRRLAEINGVPVEAHLGRRVREVVPGVADAAEALFAKVLETGKEITGVELSGETPARPGVLMTWSESWRPVRDAAGEIVGVSIVAEEITERKAAEARLRDSEATARDAARLLDTVIETSPNPIWVKDREGRFTLVNSAVARVFGRPREDFPGRTDREIASPDFADHVEAIDRRVLAGETVEGEERLFSAAQGEERDFLSVKTPLRADDGTIVGVFGMAFDVTERRRAETALIESEERFRTLADATPALLVVTDGQGRNTYVNRSFADYTGRPQAELLGRGWVEIVHPDDLEKVESDARRARLTGGPFVGEMRLRSAENEWRWHMMRGLPIDAPGRGRDLWVGVCTDIHDRRVYEERLRRLNIELTERVAQTAAERDRLWRMSGDMLGVCDLEGMWRSVNPAWERVLGYDVQSTLPRHFTEFQHPDDVRAAAAELGRLIEGEAVEGFESRYRHADGDWRWISWTAVADGGLIYVVGRDVTEQRAAAERLKLAQESLFQAQKVEQIGQLTGGVAHDFNNLLAVISANLELARKRVGDLRALRLIDGAMQGAERGAALTKRLLAFARRQELATRSVALGTLVEGMRELLARTLGPTIEVATEIPASLPPARIDPSQMEVAILNLAVNARDAMPSGGRLTIAAEAREAREGERPDLRAGSYVRLTVSDTGLGMDEEVLRRAAEPFFTTKGVGKGTGLGLPMVQGVAAQLGGAMDLASRRGEGTSVSLWLPQADAEAAPASANEPTDAKAADARLTVLVVDDDALVGMGTAAMLEDLGHDVLTALSGAEALQLLEARPDIRVVVTDQAMPGMTGVELADAARARRPDLVVVLATGYADLAGGAGAGLPRLSKPFRQDQLAEALARAGEPA